MCFITRNATSVEDRGLERMRLPIISTLLGTLALASVFSTVLTIWE